MKPSSQELNNAAPASRVRPRLAANDMSGGATRCIRVPSMCCVLALPMSIFPRARHARVVGQRRPHYSVRPHDGCTDYQMRDHGRSGSLACSRALSRLRGIFRDRTGGCVQATGMVGVSRRRGERFRDPRMNVQQSPESSGNRALEKSINRGRYQTWMFYLLEY